MTTLSIVIWQVILDCKRENNENLVWTFFSFVLDSQQTTGNSQSGSLCASDTISFLATRKDVQNLSLQSDRLFAFPCKHTSVQWFLTRKQRLNTNTISIVKRYKQYVVINRWTVVQMWSSKDFELFSNLFSKYAPSRAFIFIIQLTATHRTKTSLQGQRHQLSVSNDDQVCFSFFCVTIKTNVSHLFRALAPSQNW